jgi:uncharacterized protein (DUF3084 family)
MKNIKASAVVTAFFALFFASTTLLFWVESSEGVGRMKDLERRCDEAIAKANTKKSDAEDEARKARDEGVLKTRENDDLRKQIVVVRNAATATKAADNAKLIELQGSLNETGARLEEVARESETAKSDAAAARKDADEIEKSLSEERARIEALNAELARLRDEGDAVALKKANDELTKENAALTARFQKIQDTDPAKAQAQIEEKDKTIAERDETIAARDKTIEGKDQRISELEKRIKELEERVEALEKDNKRAPKKTGVQDRHGI